MHLGVQYTLTLMLLGVFMISTAHGNVQNSQLSNTESSLHAKICTVSMTTHQRCKNDTAIYPLTCHELRSGIYCNYTIMRRTCAEKSAQNDTRRFCCRRGVRNYDCESYCITNSSTSVRECSNRSNTNRLTLEDFCDANYASSGCICSETRVKCQDEVYNGTHWVIATKVTIMGGYMIKGELNRPRVYKKEKRSNTGTAMELDGDVIKITVDDPTDMIANCQKGSWYIVVTLTSIYTEIKVPDDVFQVEGHLSVTVMIQGSVDARSTFKIPGRSYCRTSECLICYDAWENLGCLPSNTKLIVGLAALIWALFILVVIVVIILIIRAILKCDYSLFHCCRRGKSTNESEMNLLSSPNAESSNNIHIHVGSGDHTHETKVCNKADRLVAIINDPETTPSIRTTVRQQLASHISDESPEIQGRYMKYVTPNTSLGNGIALSCILLFALFCPTVYSCDNLPIVSSSSAVCTVADMSGLQTCTMEMTFSGYMFGSGSTLCLSIVDNTSTVVANYKVEMTSFRIIVDTSFSYYTCDWWFTSSCRKLCPSEIGCRYSAGSSYDVRNYNGESNPGACFDERPLADRCLITGLASERPGRSTVHQHCGCVTCGGCFYCDQDCVYCRGSVVADGECYEVRTMNTMSHVVMMKLTLAEETTQATEYPMALGTTIQTGYLRIQLNSAQEDISTIFGSKTLIIGAGKNYVGVSAPLNAPKSGIPGDLQTNDITTIRTDSKDSYIFDWSSISSTVVTGGKTYTYPAAGIKTLNVAGAYPVLPATFGSATWSYDGNGQLVGISNSRPAIGITGTLAGKNTIRRVASVVCPKASFVNATGCSSCDEGVIINILIKSTCVAGSVLVRAKSGGFVIVTGSVAITSSEMPKQIRITTNNVSNAGVITFCQETRCSEISVNFVAPRLQMVRNDTFNQTTTISTPGLEVRQEADLLGGFLNNLPDWSRWLIVIGLSILGVIVIVGLLYLAKMAITGTKFANSYQAILAKFGSNKSYSKLADEIATTTN